MMPDELLMQAVLMALTMQNVTSDGDDKTRSGAAVIDLCYYFEGSVETIRPIIGVLRND